MASFRLQEVTLAILTLAGLLHSAEPFSALSAKKHLVVACFAPVAPSVTCTTTPHGPLFAESGESSEESKSAIEEELESLQNQLTLIEALEERNKSQLESFVDEQDQWESLEEEERQLLESKSAITQRMETLAEELVQLWMGAKSHKG